MTMGSVAGAASSTRSAGAAATSSCSATGVARGRRRRFGLTHADTGRVQTAQRLVEGGGVAELRVVGRQRDDVVTEDVGGEALQRLLRPDLHEHAGSRVVQRPQTLHELDRRRHLGGQQVEHLGDHVGPHRVEVARDVRHDWDVGRPQLEALQCSPQWLAGRRHDRGVEGMAHGEHGGLEIALLASLDGSRDGSGRATDHRLGTGVDVGDDDVAVGLGDDFLDLLQRREHGSHRPVVVHGEVGHLATRER